jgi:hypothetical protein
VLECDHGKPVGALHPSTTGLTCADKKESEQGNGAVNSDSDRQLRVGTPRKFRIVGAQDGGRGVTRFSLVYLELPRESGNTTD